MKKRTAAPKTSSMSNVLCVVTDRMNLGFLGAYGNDWVGTEAFDRLAAESTLFDQYYATSLNLTALYHSFWSGLDPEMFALTESSKTPVKESILHRLKRNPLPTGLPADFKRLGYRTILLTDSREIVDHPAASGFDRIEFLDWPTLRQPAESIEETRFFSCFAQIADSVLSDHDGDSPFFVWAHLTGFGGVWDFPTSLREECVEDEEDPAPYDALIPPFLTESLPNRSSRKKRPEDSRDSESSDHEPDYDLFQAISETYAAGMTVWDRSMGCLIGVLKDSGLFDSTMILLGSARGFPMGEHGRVGFPPGEKRTDAASIGRGTSSDAQKSESGASSLFYSEELHLPLLIHFPDHFGEAVRSSGLCGPSDLYRTLAEFGGLVRDSEPEGANDPLSFGGVKSDAEGLTPTDGNPPKRQTLLALATEETESIRPYLILVEKDAASRLRGVVTDEWFLIRKGGGSEEDRPTVELYLKPDDRWDVNEVADRCEETVGELLSLIDNGPEGKSDQRERLSRS